MNQMRARSTPLHRCTMNLSSFLVGIFLHSIIIISVLHHGHHVAAAASRDVISFNFGWRHRTGLTEWADPNSQPPEDTDPGLHPREASNSYDDDDWLPVQLPHDALIGAQPSQQACPNGCSGKSYIPRHVLWYRKEFFLPLSWKDDDSRIWLEFDGSFRNTTVWVNGKWQMNHPAGYLPFKIPINSIANFGQETNIIAVFVDPDNGDQGGRSHGSGWWYEGGGLYRNVRLIRAEPVHFSSNGLFVHSQVEFSGDSKRQVSAVLSIEASIENDGKGHEEVCVQLEVFDPDDKVLLVSLHSEPSIIDKGKIFSIVESSRIMSPKLWTTLTPTLYKIKASLSICSTGEELDVLETHHGFRSIRFDANAGFFLNEEYYKIRGFCDHDSFGIVGMAVPDRVNLFRAQASRSIGGNGRRASHNPPDPNLLDIYDQLGMVVIDENRLFANNSKYVSDMAGLVLRDRNHPSVVLWSFCNEMGCEGDHETGGPAFQNVVERYDGTRPTLANMFTFNDLLSNTVDVQGFSHEAREKLDDCHKAMSNKPIMMSECCSCNTMRGEDIGCETKKDNPHYDCDQIAFNARCLEKLVNASDGVDYAAGTMVWTLFDYYGEPPSAGLTVSSTYGQFDLVGFPKASAFWFRTQWLLGISDQRPDKPFQTQESVEVHIVESWESPDTWNQTRGNATRTVHAYTNAQSIELLVNGKSQGSLPVSPMVDGDGGSYAEWSEVPWEGGTLAAVARSSDGSKLAQTDRSTSGVATTLALSLDCPSISTGTGEAVLLDGQDVALVRASILDASGKVVHMATNNVSFAILSGPGRIQGTGNGDPKSYEPNNVPWQSAYHGLVRAVVQVTSIAAFPPEEIALMDAVDGPAGMLLRKDDDQDIVIEAASPGLSPVQLTIPTTTDALSASVVAVAASTAGKPVDFFGGGENYGDIGMDASIH